MFMRISDASCHKWHKYASHRCSRIYFGVILTGSFFFSEFLNLEFLNFRFLNLKAFAETVSLGEMKRTDSQQAESLYQMGRVREAIALWLQMLDRSPSPQIKAALHNNLAIAYRQIGRMSEAIGQWQKAIEIYKASSDRLDQVRLAQSQVELAQAYLAIGQQQQAIQILQSVVLPDLLSQNNGDQFLDRNSAEQQQVAIAIKGSLGNAHFALGDYDRALSFYQEGLSLATTLLSPTQATPSLGLGWLNVGNTLAKRAERYTIQIKAAMQEGEQQEAARLQGLRDRDLENARSAYARSLTYTDTDPILRVKVLLNFAHLLDETKDSQFSAYQREAATLIDTLPTSREKIHALIDLASLPPDPNLGATRQITLLEKAIATAETIGDLRSQSFALGSLGKIYEMQGEYKLALDFTDRAQWIAQQINAGDSLYRWQWQSGRIYKALGKPQEAMKAYRQAIASIQSIRSDIIAADRNFQFDVRDGVEPVYRELMELLLSLPNSGDRDRQVEEALKISELLRLSELQNFFGDECIEIQTTQQIDQIFAQQKAAFIYSIILERQTFVVLRLPDGSLKTYSVPRSQAQLSSKIESLRLALEKIATDEYLAPAQEVYNLLMRPMETDLARSQVELLVFVNDGALRSVPMAALHDGKQFLIQKYPVVALLGTSLSNKATDTQSIRQISFGLSEAISPFAALPNVPQELQGIHNLIAGEQFLNRDFTLETLTRKVKEGYTVIHLATHAKFGTTPESTFLQAFDRQISLEQLETILRSSATAIELLVLSACQTATGDNRATLGLAGIALRSGVKSVLATLWSVNDADVVPFITDFYREWRKSGVTKAEALRRAQIKNITSYSGHPAIWSPFILVGN